MADICFVFKIVNGLFDSQDLLDLVSLNVPQRHLRGHLLFRVDHHLTNYGQNSPIVRSVRYLNANAYLDVFGESLLAFRRSALRGMRD